jgi:hypothetical protein
MEKGEEGAKREGEREGLMTRETIRMPVPWIMHGTEI